MFVKKPVRTAKGLFFVQVFEGGTPPIALPDKLHDFQNNDHDDNADKDDHGIDLRFLTA
jgi:hypothetical protein